MLRDYITLLGAAVCASVNLSAASLTNLSVRTTLQSQQVLTVGFTTQGETKNLLVRAVGPSLGALGVTDAMADPALAVFDGPNRVDGNDNWGGSPALASAFSAVGAFPLVAPGSADAALLVAATGGRTVQVSGSAAGNVIVEVYETPGGSVGRLTNLSALNRVGTGNDLLIAGFTIGGSGTTRLLIRAVGPSLAPLGVPDTLRDPLLSVFNARGEKLTQNDNFTADLAPMFASVGAFPLIVGGRDSALITYLPAGGYTVQISGADGGTGTALIEVYELSADVWTRNGWTKPEAILSVATAATRGFSDYVATVRNPNQPLTFEIQPGADPIWSEWIPKGVTLVARTFEYPPLVTPYTAVAGLDRTWFIATFTRLYGSAVGKAQGATWDRNESPAWGESPTAATNSWNLEHIRTQKLMQTDAVGMAQTPGHEFFHAVQRALSGRPSSTEPGLFVPADVHQWFWEGPAMFVGMQAANHLGFNSYLANSRPVMVNRTNSGATAALRLEQVTTNTPPAIDPYGIGCLATELLVANVGMERFLNIYREVARGRTFHAAFGVATGVTLADFFLMFEDARSNLGIPIKK